MKTWRRICILTLTAVFFLPAYRWLGERHGHGRHRWRAGRPGELRQIGLALRMYSADHQEQFPPSLWHLFDHGYLTHPRYFVSPADVEPQPIVDCWELNRLHYLLEGTGGTEDEYGTTMPVLVYPFGRQAGAHRFAVLFGDGHVKLFLPSQFRSLWENVMNRSRQGKEE